MHTPAPDPAAGASSPQPEGSADTIVTAAPGDAAAPPATTPRPTRTPAGTLPPGRTERIEQVVAQELRTGPLHPGQANWLEHPPRDLIGLALSGGGIRSATFNLGLLQGLCELRLLPAFDYLATVSGGGYLGSFWTAWRHRADGREGDFPNAALPGEPEPREIRHLREFSNFLAPRLGLFSYDTGRMLVTAISAMLPSLLAALSVLTLAVLGWIAACWLLLSPAMDRWSVWMITAATLFTLAGFEAAWRRRTEPSDGRAYEVATLIGLVTTAGAWAALSRPWFKGLASLEAEAKQVIAKQPIWQDWRQVLAPAAAWGAAFLVLVIGRWFFSRDAGSPRGIRFRRAADRVRSRLLMLAAVWTLGALVWAAGLYLEARVVAGNEQVTIPSLGGLTALMAAVFAKAQHLVSKQKSTSTGGRLLALLKPWLPQILSVGVIVALTLGVVGTIAAGSSSLGPLEFPLAMGACAVLVLLLVLVLMDPNEVGLHSFYRARLVRAYAGASNNHRAAPRQPRPHTDPLQARAAAAASDGPARKVALPPDTPLVKESTASAGSPASNSPQAEVALNRETEVIEQDDIPLDQLAGGSGRPFHLVCCAANDINSADAMAALYRGATSATLSREGCSVGSAWLPWHEYPTAPTLGAAMTASAAAFNTLMGALSVKMGLGVTFVAAALNLRLGLWIANPAHRATPHRRRLPGIAFLREMFGRASANGRWVHLSDGGHFENLAIYELIRRHCRVIVASDCGMDSDSAFDDLGNLVRRVREDFEVEVQLDTGPLKPGSDGFSRQHVVAGDIHYPDGDTGVLLLFKPVVVGNEPVDVAQYRRRNPIFPHESTGDQFYDEAQWESYRRLGLHASHGVFRGVLEGLELEAASIDQPRAWMEAFGRARREWQPKPEGFDERLSHFADRVAELDGALRQPGAETLLHQVYKELDELDRRKLPFGQPIFGAARAATEPPAPPSGAPASPPAPTVERVHANGERSPAPPELSLSLYLIRRALLLMEEVFESENLATSYSHPLYLGLMNWFARWAYAPLFRMWWPLLKTMYPQPFTRFLEKHFSLVSVDRAAGAAVRGAGAEAVTTTIEQDAPGFARTCWLLAGGEIPPNRKALSYNLHMLYERTWLYRVQAAQVIVDDSASGALIWKAAEFFVPPGLWGVGIGTDFLSQLQRPGADPDTAVQYLVVQVDRDPLGSAATRKRAADEMQLYRTAGFCDARLDEQGVLVSTRCRVALPPEWAGGDTERTQWMVAALDDDAVRMATVP